MNLEELKQFKNELEIPKKAKYIPWSYNRCSIDFSKEKTLEEYRASDDTDRMVQQFELLMEMATKELSDLGIIFDFVQIIIDHDFLVDRAYCEKYIAIDNDSYTRNEKIYGWYENLSDHILRDYMNITLSLDGCLYDDYHVIPFVELRKKCDAEKKPGIVNIEKFISKIKDLGYIVTLDDCYNKDTFEPATVDEYINTILDEVDSATYLNIIADFREKEKTGNMVK